MIASGYTVTMICDVCHWTTEEFGGSEKSSTVWRGVRSSGWKVRKKTSECICPECVKVGATWEDIPNANES